MQIDLDKYTDFVEAITSQASNDLTTFINSLIGLMATMMISKTCTVLM